MKRYEATQMNTCASTDASACAAAPSACHAASAMILNMDTAILAVSIVLVLLVVSICLAADNFIAPQGRISIRTG